MVLTYIGPLNQKYFGIKHQPGHIISAASSSRLVGPSLLASYISDRHLFQVNRTHQHVRFQDTYTLHRSKRWYQKTPASTVKYKQNWEFGVIQRVYMESLPLVCRLLTSKSDCELYDWTNGILSFWFEHRIKLIWLSS